MYVTFMFISAGDNFDEEHAKRAFSLRLGHDQPNKTPLVANLQKPFRIATPTVGKRDCIEKLIFASMQLSLLRIQIHRL